MDANSVPYAVDNTDTHTDRDGLTYINIHAYANAQSNTSGRHFHTHTFSRIDR